MNQRRGGRIKQKPESRTKHIPGSGKIKSGMSMAGERNAGRRGETFRESRGEEIASRHASRAHVPQGDIPRERFLPVSRADMEARGIRQLDFIYVTGDAYVDHPSFGSAIISRVLEAHGYSVGIIAQPDWKNPESVTVLGRPRLGFLVSAGNMDSMVNHYTVFKKRRHEDAYTPGGVSGKRPDRACMVYCNLIRSVFRDVPIIAGGIEASLRRLAHYDYWENKIRRSLLMDCGADLISYGMGEHSIVEIADALDSGLDVSNLTFIAGTCYKTKRHEDVVDYLMLPSFEELQADRLNLAKSFRIQMQNTDPFNGKRLVEPYGTVWVVQNPPAKPLTQQEMDDVYALPYAGTYHPDYISEGGIPALEEVDVSPGENRADALRRVHPGGGGADDKRPTVQRVHPRCRRTDCEFSPAVLQKAAHEGGLSEPRVPLAGAVPESRGVSCGLHEPSEKTQGDSGRSEGVCALRRPVRLCVSG